MLIIKHLKLVNYIETTPIISKKTTSTKTIAIKLTMCINYWLKKFEFLYVKTSLKELKTSKIFT